MNYTIEDLIAFEKGARIICERLEHEVMANKDDYKIANELMHYSKIHNDIITNLKTFIDEKYTFKN